MKYSFNKLSLLIKGMGIISLLLLAACDTSDDIAVVDANANVIIATVAADFSSGAHSVISKDENGERTALNELSPTGSDITIAAFGENFYRIERAFAGNNITKFASSDPQTAVWQYSTNDDSSDSSDPHDIIFVSETKAYVMRYGTGIVWIVNPSAINEAGFKIGELDLSGYDADGVPQMDSGVVVDGRLYIIMQRLDGFSVTQNGYIAIFDTATDVEIDANIDGDALKGIPLAIRNPTKIEYNAEDRALFIQASGSFFPEEFTGGIERISLGDFSSTLIVDDGSAGDHPRGLITKMAVISDSLMYFVGYMGFTDNTLYKMNLITNEITETDVTSLVSGQIANLSVDGDGNLWVSDTANATVRIIDTATDTEIDAFSTTLNPEKVVFTE